jgi:hypothetical protein
MNNLIFNLLFEKAGSIFGEFMKKKINFFFLWDYILIYLSKFYFLYKKVQFFLFLYKFHRV